MFDFDRLIRLAVENGGTKKAVVGFLYDRPRQILKDLRDEGVIAGAIGDDSGDANANDECRGWWRDRAAGRIAFASGARIDTLLLFGAPNDCRIDSGLAAAARDAGIRKIITADANGAIVEVLDPAAGPQSGPDAVDTSVRPVAGLDFRAALDDCLNVIGDSLLLPRGEFDPKKIMISIGSLGPGGAERQASYFAAEIARQGDYNVHVVCDSTAPPGDFFRDYTASAGACVEEFQASPEEFEMPAIKAALEKAATHYPTSGLNSVIWVIVRCASAMRRIRPSVVHAWMDYHNVLSGLAASLVGVPRLALSGRSVAPDQFRIFQPYMKPGYQSLLSRRGAVFLNNSYTGARDYERWLNLPSGSIRTVHNGFEFPEVDRSAARRRLRGKFNWDDQTPVVGSILRFSEEKNPRLIVEAAADAIKAAPNLRFAFFGDGPLRVPMRQLASELGVENVIALPGATTEPWAELAGMDVFVLASRMEGLPNVMVEAQIMGVPVVCSGVGGMIETFVSGETGMVAPAASAKEFSAVITRLINDPDRLGRMSTAAKEFAIGKFSIGRMCADTLASIENEREITVKASNENMTKGSERFWFGRNWHGFIKRNFSEERAETAKNKILGFMGRTSLKELDMLDIGCGSGLHSYAAWKAGARRVHSFDYDENSVSAAKLLWEIAGKPANWTIERGDALDKKYMDSLGKWNFVYSWGVLHHTGAMWEAVRNAQACVTEGGQFYIALYASDVQPEAEMWLRVKQAYVKSGWLGRRGWELWYVWNHILGRRITRLPTLFHRMYTYKVNRGMDLFTDIRDWLGGWPMEFAADQDTVNLLERECGFTLRNISTGEACSEFLFERSGSPTTPSQAKEMVEKLKRERA